MRPALLMQPHARAATRNVSSMTLQIMHAGVKLDKVGVIKQSIPVHSNCLVVESNTRLSYKGLTFWNALIHAQIHLKVGSAFFTIGFIVL